MTTITEIRSKYPQYKDMSDEDLAKGLHSKHYSDMSYEDFAAKIGMTPQAPEREANRFTSAVGGVQNVMTFGFGDEIEAGIGSVIPANKLYALDGKTDIKFGQYKENLAEIRKRNALQKESNPKTYLAGEIGGGIATGAGIANTVKTAGLKVGPKVAAMTGGAVYGAGNAEGNPLERADDAAKGAAFALAFGIVGEKIGNRGMKILQAMKDKKALVDPATKKLTPKALSVLKRLGMEADEITPDVEQAIVTKFQGGADIQDAARAADAAALPNPVPLTTGQRTLNPDAMRLEAAAFDGNFGLPARQVAKEAFDSQQNVVQQNAGTLRETMTGLAPVTRQEAGAGIAGRIANEGQAAKSAAVSVRRAAEDGKAFAPKSILNEVVGRSRARMNELGDVAGTEVRDTVEGKILKSLDSVVERGEKGQLPANVILKLRGKASSELASASGSAKNELGKMVKDFDGLLDDAIERGLLKGDEEAVKAYGKSTKLFADYYKRYEGKAGARKIIAKMNDGTLEPENVSALFFGNQGFTPPKSALGLAREIRKELGPDSQEWQSLRGEALTRLFQEDATTGRIGQKFSSQLEKALTQNSAMMREIFNPDEVQVLRRFGRVVRSIEARPPTRGNSSNSTNLAAFFKRMGGGAVVDTITSMPILKDVVRGISEGNTARKVAKSVNP